VYISHYLASFLSTNTTLAEQDIQMPVMDGITATKEIRKMEKQSATTPIPIIGLSGNAREFHAVNALNSGLVRASFHAICGALDDTNIDYIESLHDKTCKQGRTICCH
jgi:CheY-like chemotaxis protein